MGGLLGGVVGADRMGRGPGDRVEEGGEDRKTSIEEPGTAFSPDTTPTLARISEVLLLQPQEMGVFCF